MSRVPLTVQSPSVPSEGKAFLGQLGADAERRFQLTAVRRGGRAARGAYGGYLIVGVAIMGGERKIVGVERPVEDVFIDMERSILIGRERSGGIHETAGIGAGADFGRGPAIRILQGDVPGGGAAEREAAENDAVGIDLEPALHRCDALEDIDFTGLVVGVVSAAVAIERELSDVGGVGGIRELRGILEAVDEAGFGRAVAAAMQPHVKTIRLAGVIGIGNGHAHRLHGAVERRVVAEDLPALLHHPGRLAILQLVSALEALILERPGSS